MSPPWDLDPSETTYRPRMTVDPLMLTYQYFLLTRVTQNHLEKRAEARGQKVVGSLGQVVMLKTVRISLISPKNKEIV